MDKITSLQNEIVKAVVRLQDKNERNKKGLILLEGEKLIKGALDAGIQLEKVFVLGSCDLKFNAQTFEVDEKVMKKMSTTSSSPKVLAVAKKRLFNEDSFQNFKKILLLDGIQDGGNLGTIIRTALAFGIEGIILYGNCTDPYAPKVLRSTVGTVFKMPVIFLKDIDMFSKSHKLIATVMQSGNKINKKFFEDKFILMMGSEASGLSKELILKADETFTLDMNDNVESLNLAVATAICLWEIYKN